MRLFFLLFLRPLVSIKAYENHHFRQNLKILKSEDIAQKIYIYKKSSLLSYINLPDMVSRERGKLAASCAPAPSFSFPPFLPNHIQRIMFTESGNDQIGLDVLI